MRQLPSATALLLLASAVAQAQPAPGAQHRRDELRQALQDQRQAQMQVGPPATDSLGADALSPERRLSLQQRQELRRQLQSVRHSAQDSVPSGKP